MHPVMIAARLVVRDMGGADEAAKHLGKSGSTLEKELNPNHPGAKLGVLDVVTLTQVRDDTRIVEAIALDCGGMFLATPRRADGADETTMQHVADLVADFGLLLRSVSETTADDRVTDNELDRVREQSLQVMGELQSLLVGLAKLNQAAKPPALRAA